MFADFVNTKIESANNSIFTLFADFSKSAKSRDTILNYLFPLFFHGPFGPVFFFRTSFANNTSGLSSLAPQ